MQYVAITQGTCSWLQQQPGVVSALHQLLLHEDLAGLRQTEFATSSLRLAGSSDGRILAIWNKEYMLGTGKEVWGIFRLANPAGLAGEPSISKQVFERLLYVFNQRLQGLFIDGDFIHRARENGSHTCLAGRGTETRQYSIAYFEAGPGYSTLSNKAIIAVGPEHVFEDLDKAVEREFKHFPVLVDEADALTNPKRRRPLAESAVFTDLRHALNPNSPELSYLEGVDAKVKRAGDVDGIHNYQTIYWNFDQWMDSGILSDVQRRVMSTDPLARHPLRIIGPAGSGKTLLMQLLALYYLRQAQQKNVDLKILYIVHSLPMAQMVIDRFRTLGSDEFLSGSVRTITVSTLTDYGKDIINLKDANVIDKDAQKTKSFQLEQVQDALRYVMNKQNDVVERTQLIKQLRGNQGLLDIFSLLVMAEISTVIKGRGLTEDKNKYVNAEVPLSRLHGILKADERAIIFDCFSRYNEIVFDGYEMLDTDDIALTLEGRLRTPLWSLKRKVDGFDLVFVDEAQLFNENERRIFPYLTKGVSNYVPIALALDEAQEPFGFSTAGLATLGIANVESESLPSNHRSTKEIVDLAFYVIQQTTDLFGPEFPDFTSTASNLIPSTNPLSAPPIIVRCNEEVRNYGKHLVKVVGKLRGKNIRQIAIVCHAEQYWDEIERELSDSELPLHVIAQRGEKISPDQPLVILSRPAHVGGQEFDAVIVVGLEQGVVPPRIADNPPLSAALEQQALREIYLSISRARYRVIVSLSLDAEPNALIAKALQRGLLVEGNII